MRSFADLAQQNQQEHGQGTATAFQMNFASNQIHNNNKIAFENFALKTTSAVKTSVAQENLDNSYDPQQVCVAFVKYKEQQINIKKLTSKTLDLSDKLREIVSSIFFLFLNSVLRKDTVNYKLCRISSRFFFSNFYIID